MPTDDPLLWKEAASPLVCLRLWFVTNGLGELRRAGGGAVPVPQFILAALLDVAEAAPCDYFGYGFKGGKVFYYCPECRAIEGEPHDPEEICGKRAALDAAIRREMERGESEGAS